jgi:hypothetical protein
VQVKGFVAVEPVGNVSSRLQELGRGMGRMKERIAHAQEVVVGVKVDSRSDW